MLVVNIPKYGFSKIPGCELAFQSFFSRYKNLYDEMVEKHQLIKIDTQEIDLTKIEYIKNKIGKESVLFFGGTHAITHFVFDNIIEKKYSIIVFDAHNDVSYEEEKVCNWNWINKVENKINKGLVVGYRDKRSDMPKHKKFVYLEDYMFYSDSFLKLLENMCIDENIYISIDLDVLNPKFFQGVSHPIGGGLLLNQLLYLIRFIKEKCKRIIWDIVEFNPIVERNQSSEMIKRILELIIE